MVVPPGFQAEHVQRDAALPELGDFVEDLLGGIPGWRARHEPEAPLRGQRAASAKQVVAADRLHHGRPGKDVHVHAAGRHQRLDGIGPRVGRPGLASRSAIDHRWFHRRRQSHADADGHGHVTRCVDEHPVAARRDVERHGRVCASCPSTPMVDVELKRRACPSHGLEVHPEAVHLFVLARGGTGARPCRWRHVPGRRRAPAETARPEERAAPRSSARRLQQ